MLPTTVFFSYSHLDEAIRDQLEVHLAGLKRQGLISAWHDRKIIAGSEFENAIDENLEAAAVILLLVSPDFLNSDYCYKREMRRAMERHEKKEARVIPVIIRPCDWHDLPFGKLLCAPTDGKPVTLWPDRDQAFLDVVRAIKAALRDTPALTVVSHPAASTPAAWIGSAQEALAGPRSSNLRVKKQFTQLDLDKFRQDGFEYIAKYFQNSMKELVTRNLDLNEHFQRIDATCFKAAVYRNGMKACKGSAYLASGLIGGGSISYVMNDEAGQNEMNEAVYVKADDQSIFFEALRMQSHGRRDEKLTPQGAAELFWELFIKPIQ